MRPISRTLLAYVTVLLMLLAATNFWAAREARSLDLGDLAGDILKIAGVSLLVSEFADEIDDGINRIMMKEGVMPTAKTKVVPIIRIGTGDPTAVGAAQVVGPRSQVERVQAVAEGAIGIGSLSGRVLIPTTAKKAYTRSVRGVGGVGVSANIKLNL